MDSASHSKGMLSLVAGALTLGFAAIYVKWAAAAGAGPLAVGFYRMLFALPLVVGLALTEREGRGSRSDQLWALTAGVFFIGDLWLWHLALDYTSAANATLLVGLSPLWVALASVAFLGAQLRKRAWTGLGLAIGGAAILALAKGARWGTGWGETLGFLASFCYAFFTLALTRARRGMGARSALLLVVLCCLAGFGLGAWGLGEPLRGYSVHGWWALVGLGVIVQCCAWFLITWGMGHLPAHAGAVGLMLQQVATVALGWLMLGEAVKPLQGLGTLLILLGVGLSVSAPPLALRSVAEPQP